jgi:hypothetical protein
VFTKGVPAATAAGAQFSPVDRLRATIEQSVPPAHATRWKRLVTKPSPDSFVNFSVCLASQLYEQRAQLKDALVEFVCDTMRRDKDLWSATKDVRSVTKNMTHFDHDLGNYAMRYQPPDFQRLKDETVPLRKLTATCAAHGTRLILINMPLTKENKALLNPKLYTEYRATLKAAAKPGSVEYIDSESFSKQFVRDEFLDSAHLNREGSKRLRELLAPEIARSLSSGARVPE